MKIICIYKISSNTTDRIYIGSAVDFNARKRVHLSQLRKGKHHSIKLQRHVDKYGITDLNFEMLEKVISVQYLLKREQVYLDQLKPYFNHCKVAGNSLGTKRSAKFCKNLSLLHKGNKYWLGKNHTQETKDKFSIIGKRRRGKTAPNYGIKFTKEHKLKLSESHVGIKFSEERKRSMRVPHNSGIPISQLSKEGKLIKTWDKVIVASIELNISKNAISNCLVGRAKLSGGFNWKYA